MKFNYAEWIKGCDFTDPSVCVEKIKELVLTEGLEAEQVMYGFHLVNEKNLNRLYHILKNDNKENKSKKEQKSKLKEQLDIVSRENSIIKKELAKMGLSFKELMKKGLSEEEYNVFMKYEDENFMKEKEELKKISERRNIEIPKKEVTVNSTPKKKVIVIKRKPTN